MRPSPPADPLDDYAYFFPLAFLLAAQRAFISCESLLRPAAVIPPPFLRVDAVAALPFFFAHRALIAAAILARLSADILVCLCAVRRLTGILAKWHWENSGPGRGRDQTPCKSLVKILKNRR